MEKGLCEIVDEFKGKKVLVVGDIMLDKYVFGEVTRISPEAPVQIISVKRQEYVPGGAANTANNIVALAGIPMLAGVIGRDDDGKKLVEQLKARSIGTDGIHHDKSRPTTAKQRIIAHTQQLLRIDHEGTTDISKRLENRITKYAKKKMGEADIVVMSDYAKGTLTYQASRAIIEAALAHNKTVIVDPRPQHKAYYKDATIITPNVSEAEGMAKLETGIEAVGKRLVSDLNSIILMTRGADGMSLFEKDGSMSHYPTAARVVYDVSGAGDTVVAALAMSLAAGASLYDAIKIANHAAGIVVGKLGTATATAEELKKGLEGK